jgi:hypothetical protein
MALGESPLDDAHAVGVGQQRFRQSRDAAASLLAARSRVLEPDEQVAFDRGLIDWGGRALMQVLDQRSRRNLGQLLHQFCAGHGRSIRLLHDSCIGVATCALELVGRRNGTTRPRISRRADERSSRRSV